MCRKTDLQAKSHPVLADPPNGSGGMKMPSYWIWANKVLSWKLLCVYMGCGGWGGGGGRVFWFWSLFFSFFIFFSSDVSTISVWTTTKIYFFLSNWHSSCHSFSQVPLWLTCSASNAGLGNGTRSRSCCRFWRGGRLSWSRLLWRYRCPGTSRGSGGSSSNRGSWSWGGLLLWRGGGPRGRTRVHRDGGEAWGEKQTRIRCRFLAYWTIATKCVLDRGMSTRVRTWACPSLHSATHSHTHTHTCMYKFTCTQIHILMHVEVHMYTHTHTYACSHVHPHTSKHKIHTHTHTHTLNNRTWEVKCSAIHGEVYLAHTPWIIEHEK